MIVRELYSEGQDGVKLFRTYSSVGKRILQEDTGDIYDEAIDIEGTPHTYVETDECIGDDEDDFLEPQEALDAIFGGPDDGEIHEE